MGKNKGVQFAVAFLLSLGLSVPAAFAAETIRIGGTGSALGAMRALGEAFRKQYPNMEVVVVSGLGAAAQTNAARIGLLTPGKGYEPVLTGLREGLEKLGYKEGQNIRFLVGDSDRGTPQLDSTAAKLVEAGADVLFAVTTPAALAAKRATAIVPIVFVAVGVPVEAGLVASFASSGNNLTGVSSYAASLSGKRLELLKQIVPKAKRILLIASANEAISQLSAHHSEESARKLGLQIIRRELASAHDIEKLLVERWAGPADAVSLVPAGLSGSYIERIISKANKERLPAIVYEDTLVKMGALASYGSDRSLTGIQAAKLVAKILKGTKPSNIPIETPDRFILSVNLATAKAIGLRIPRTVLDRVDRLVE